MINHLKESAYWRLGLSLCSLGLGQSLILGDVLRSWAHSRTLTAVIVLVGLGFCFLGLRTIIPQLLWFYQTYKSDRRLGKSVLGYGLTSVLSGLTIGGLGQLIYDQTSLEYVHVKSAIWVLSSLVQVSLKIGLVFALSSIFGQVPIRSRLQTVLSPLVFAWIMVSLGLALTIWLPSLGRLVLAILDAGLVLLSLRYFNRIFQEDRDEKTS